MKKLALCLILTAAVALPQAAPTTIAGSDAVTSSRAVLNANYTGLYNFFRQGTVLPATCTVGNHYLLTLAAPYILYACTATNTWTPLGTICGSTGQVWVAGPGAGCAGYAGLAWNDTTKALTVGILNLESDLSTANGRLLLSSTAANSGAGFTLLPSGTAPGATFAVRNSSDRLNYGRTQWSLSGATATFGTFAVGTGTPVTQWNWQVGAATVAHCGLPGQVLFIDTTGTCASGKLAWSETGDFGKGSLTIGDAVQGFEIEPGIFQGYANFYPTTANTAMEINAYPSGTNTQAGLRGYNSSDTANNAFVSLQAVGPQASLRVVSNGTPLNPITNFVIGPNQGTNTLANLASIDFIWGVNPQYKLWSVTPNGVQIGAGNQTNYPAKRTCDGTGTTPGAFWYSGHTAGAKDDVQICAADAANVWAWRTIY